MWASRKGAFRSLAIVLVGIVFVATGKGERLRRKVEKSHPTDDEFKHTVAIVKGKTFTKNGKWICSGTIISDHHVLTSAECLPSEVTKDLVVVAGVEDFTDSNGLVYAIKELIVSPLYVPNDSGSSTDYNIGLIVLKQSMVTGLSGGSLLQLYLPHEEATIGKHCKIWSKHQIGVSPTPNDNLFHVIEASFVSHDNCRQSQDSAEDAASEINPKLICAHLRDTYNCRDNPGSPLVQDEFVVGVTLKNGCHTNDMSWFTNVHYYNQWILEKMLPTYEQKNEVSSLDL